jgi:CBS domain-containing protein
MSDDIVEEELQIAEKLASDEARLSAVGLQQTIGELLTLQPAIMCERNITVRQAIETMQHERIGCILVVEQGRLVGVFTERDVLTKVAARGVDIDRQLVDALMTPDPECLRRDNELVYALNQMSVGGYRHIPILNDQGRPIGVVSMRDIIDYLSNLFPQEVLNLPPSPTHGMPRTPEGA